MHETPAYFEPFKAALDTRDLAAFNRALDHPDMDEALIRHHLGDVAQLGSLPLLKGMLARLPRHAKASTALVPIARHGQLHVLNLLLPYCSAKTKDSLALRTAALYGQVAMVERLLPLSNPRAKESEALRQAARWGHLEVVRLLTPVSDVNARHGAALRDAALRGHQAIATLLWPLTDVAHTARHLLEQRQWKELDSLVPLWPQEAWGVFKGWLAQTPKGALPQAQARWLILDRAQTAHHQGPTLERRVHRPRS